MLTTLLRVFFISPAVGAAPTILTFGSVRVHLCSEDTVRVTAFSSAEIEAGKFSRAVINQWQSPPAYNMSTTPAGLTRISTARVAVELDAASPSPETISFYRRLHEADPWERMLRDVGRSSQPVIDSDGSVAQRVGAQWAFETADEGIYGGGSQQQGFINYRGAPIQLVQQNTESAVPFFVSSRGFGLLWDCTSEIWLNALETRVAMNVNHTSLVGSVAFVPNVTGLHYITAYAGSLVWEGAFVPLTVLVDPVNITLFNWSSDTKNAPPYHTGRIELQAGVPYSIRYDLSGFAAPSDRVTSHDTVELFVSPPPPAGHHGTFSLQGSLDDFVDYYVFAGDSIDSSISLYRSATGVAPLYPKWAFGFFQSKNHYKSQDELVGAVRGFRERRLPLDTIVQDWHYWGSDDNWGPVWDPTHYPEPQRLTEDLHALKCQLMVSVWSKFNTPSLLAELESKGQLIVQQPANSTVPPPVAAGEHWMDIFQAGTASTFFGFVNKTMYGMGVDALWLDATEAAGWPQLHGHVRPGPDTNITVSGNRFMSSYSLGVTSAIHDGLHSSYPKMRTFTLTRASSAGQQRTGGALWTGDIMASWPVLRRQVAASINFGLSGMPFWSQDIGGFHRPGSEQQYVSADYRRLFTRWFQFGSLTPIFRVHGSGAPNGTEYWLYGDDVTAACNATAALRYRLLPYIYSIAAAIQDDGATLQRGLVMDFPSDPQVRDIADEYMFGPALLVAPVLDAPSVDGDGDDLRSVYLPREEVPGRRFFDFWTGAALAGGRTHEASAPLSQIPLFGRGGSLLVLGPAMEWTNQREADPLEVRVYRGADAAFSLYEDDGVTRGAGANTTIAISWAEASGVLTIGARRGSGFEGMLHERTFRVVAVCEGVGVGGGETAEEDAVLVRYSGEEIEIEIELRKVVV